MARPKNQPIYANIKPGRPAKFPTPQTMWDRAVDYFTWAEDDGSLYEQKIVNNGGAAEHMNVKKMRAFTLTGLCSFIGLDTETFRRYGTGENGSGEFKEVVTLIKQVIYEQKFVGAAADLLNPNIIARDLGLFDKTQNTNINFNSVPMTKDEIKTIENELESEF
jgi:hypothetical protein